MIIQFKVLHQYIHHTSRKAPLDLCAHALGTNFIILIELLQVNYVYDPTLKP